MQELIINWDGDEPEYKEIPDNVTIPEFTFTLVGEYQHRFGECPPFYIEVFYKQYGWLTARRYMDILKQELRELIPYE